MKHRAIRLAVAACAAVAPVAAMGAGAGATTATANGCTVTANSPTSLIGANGGTYYAGTGSAKCVNNRHLGTWMTWQVDQPGISLIWASGWGPNTPSNPSASVSKAWIDQNAGTCSGTRRIRFTVQVLDGRGTIYSQATSAPVDFSCK